MTSPGEPYTPGMITSLLRAAPAIGGMSVVDAEIAEFRRRTGPARAATGGFPYPHRTVAEVERRKG